MLTDAKQEDERKRDTLYKFYEDTEVCLNSMDDTVLRLLEQNVTNCKDKITGDKKTLEQKEYTVLVAGGLQPIYIFKINNDGIFIKTRRNYSRRERF